MPSLTDVYLPYAFDYKDDVTIRGSTHFIPLSHIVIGSLYHFINVQTPEMYEYCIDILRGSDEITDLVISGSACPYTNVTILDLSVYPRLETLIIGDYGFEYVNELKLTGLSKLKSVVIGDESFMNVNALNITGLNELESVEIGMNSFTKYKSTYNITADPDRHFYLKNCPKMKSLKMGRYSFSDYTVIEIENCALEVIEMGELNEDSYNFKYASLELKSILIHSE